MPTISADNVKTSSEIEHVDWSTGGGSGHNYTNIRYGSASSQASQSSGDICRICHCESDPQNPLLTPCYCAGSLKYVHQTCLQQWLTASETNACELCKFPFIMHTKIKPFNEWRSLDITGIERRRLCCSLLFHFAAALCVIWSLCVLIERAADDVQNGLIDWPFWTKLAVVTVGMTGGIVFMYIQCKAYLHLCHRWKARNRILLIQNAPEKIHPLSPPSPIMQHRNRRCGSVGDVRSSQRASINGTGTAVEISDNLDGEMMSNYTGYARNSVGIDTLGGAVDINETNGGAGSSMHHHHRHHHSLGMHQNHMTISPNHMLPNADLDADSLATQTSVSSAFGLPSNMLMHHHPLEHHLLHGQQHMGGNCTEDGIRRHTQPPLGQVAVAANIECSQSQQNSERDWALDDVVSQISSFRPCPQGSGSMTPFHDSIHNVLEHSEECSSRDLSTGGVSSDMGREHALQLSSFSGSGEHKAPSIGSGASNAVANGLGGFVYKPHNKRYSNSSIFLENRDILNDNDGIGGAIGLDMCGANDYGNCSTFSNYRLQSSSNFLNNSDGDNCGSSSIPTNNNNEQLDNFLGKDRRRFSDTKLHHTDNDDDDNVEVNEKTLYEISAHEPMLKKSLNDTILDTELPKSLLINQQQQQRQRQSTKTLQLMHRSMHTVEMGDEISKHSQRANNIKTIGGGGATIATNSFPATTTTTTQGAHNSHIYVFKSLPNLSSSCESLLKK